MKNIPKLNLSDFLLGDTVRKGCLHQCIVEIRPKIYGHINAGIFINGCLKKLSLLK